MRNDLDVLRNSLLSPYRDLGDFPRAFSRIYDEMNWPALDVEETESQYLMNFDLPGVKKSDIKIELNDRDLVISGEKKEEIKEGKKSRHVTERFYGSFRRVISLPSYVDPEHIQASFEDGVLKVMVPKSAANKPKQIKIGESQKPAMKGEEKTKKAS